MIKSFFNELYTIKIGQNTTLLQKCRVHMGTGPVTSFTEPVFNRQQAITVRCYTTLLV